MKVSHRAGRLGLCGRIPHGVGVCRARSRGVFRLRGKRKDIRGGLSRRIRTAWYMEGEVKVTCRVGRGWLVGDSARRGCLRGAVVGCLREAGLRAAWLVGER